MPALGPRLFINWKEQLKVRVHSNGNSPFSQVKHEVIKVMIMNAILKKHKDRNSQIIYSEWDIGNGKVADIFHINKSSQVGYEIQEKITKKWKKETIEKYTLAGVDLVIIPSKKISNNLIIMEKEIAGRVV
jgi:hypothetical protein